MKKLLLSVLLPLLCFYSISCDSDSNAQDSNIVFTANAAGYYFSGTADSNGDGSTNLINVNQGLSDELGSFNMGSQFEFVAVASIVPCVLPSGGPGLVFALVQGTQVITIISDNDQIYTEFTVLNCCFSAPGDPDPTFSLDGTAEVTGGTGQFTDATGTISYTGTGSNQFAAPDGSGVFGEINLSAEGTIELLL